MKSRANVKSKTPAGEDHQVTTVVGGAKTYRRKVCSDCPWRKDATGIFPPEAFEISANTADDMSGHKFGCHQSGVEKPATCAGFLLRGSEHNMAVRVARMTGDMIDVEEPDVELYDDYVDMAIHNGVDPEDPCLQNARRSSYATRGK